MVFRVELDRLDPHGALAAAPAVVFLLVRDRLPLGQVVIRRGAGDARRVEKDFLAVLRLDEAEATVADEPNDGTLHVCVPFVRAPSGASRLCDPTARAPPGGPDLRKVRT